MVGLEEVTWPLVVLAKMALPHQSIHLDGTNPFRTASPKHTLGTTIGRGRIPSPSGRGPHAETDFLMHAFLRSRCSFEPVHIAHQQFPVRRPLPRWSGHVRRGRCWYDRSWLGPPMTCGLPVLRLEPNPRRRRCGPWFIERGLSRSLHIF